jgi:PEP-CTERM motif
MGTVEGFGAPPGQMFNLQTSAGQLVLSYSFVNSSQGYQFGEAVFSNPEPGTLGLMAAGLAGILGLSKRRKRAALTN